MDVNDVFGLLAPYYKYHPDDCVVYTFRVMGEPYPLPRGRKAGNHVYLPAKAKRYKAMLKLATKDVDELPATHIAHVIMETCISNFRRKDIDNMLKTVMDALQPVPLRDDSIKHVRSEMVYYRYDKDNPYTNVMLVYVPTSAYDDLQG
jgi:Holliday junction resolvase RusA-like endonuclease